MGLASKPGPPTPGTSGTQRFTVQIGLPSEGLYPSLFHVGLTHWMRSPMPSPLMSPMRANRLLHGFNGSGSVMLNEIPGGWTIAVSRSAKL